MTHLAVIEESDRAEIEALIREETDAFAAADFDRWSACWVQDERTTECYISHIGGLVILNGWDQIETHMRRAFAEDLQCKMIKVEMRDFMVSVSGSMAWVTYEQVCRREDARGAEESFETRILEKQAGRWKIVYMSFASKRPSQTRPGRIAVDETRRVLWSAAGTAEMLRDHPGLTVSAGKLRAKRPKWDAALGEALERAAELHGYFDFQRFSDATGGAFRCPVILGEDEDGRVVICQVSVGDGVTYVDIDDDGATAARLRVAQAIFGLSGAQIGLATHIVAGESLIGSAEALGISVNTARTHLARIYDKTGVNSQTALVRLLLSVG